MGRAEPGSAKAIGNAIKAKGQSRIIVAIPILANSPPNAVTDRSWSAQVVLPSMSEAVSGREWVQDAHPGGIVRNTIACVITKAKLFCAAVQL